MYGQVSHSTDPNGTPDLSPVAGNDDNLEGALIVSNRAIDEVDDDDSFSKRRYENFDLNCRLSPATSIHFLTFVL